MEALPLPPSGDKFCMWLCEKILFAPLSPRSPKDRMLHPHDRLTQTKLLATVLFVCITASTVTHCNATNNSRKADAEKIPTTPSTDERFDYGCNILYWMPYEIEWWYMASCICMCGWWCYSVNLIHCIKPITTLPPIGTKNRNESSRKIDAYIVASMALV